MTGKVVINTFSEYVITVISDAQMCTPSSGCEAAIYAMRIMFQHKNSDAIILVDVAKIFSNLNRKSLPHNIKFICPEIAAYVKKCYSVLARLFVSGGLKLTSREGSTHSDPLGMVIFATGITPKFNILLAAMHNDHSKMEGFADDVTASGNLEVVRKWWETLMQIGPNHGFYPQPTKSWLVVKENRPEEAVWIFGGTSIQISTEGI